MSSIPCDHAYFSVIDLCSAFFSVPVGHETQPLFAFTHRGRQYTWTRLPQGFIDSPAVFTAVLRDALADLCLPRGSTVLQYADDLLVTAEDQDACAAATLSLLTLLAQKGFKVSRTKLQFCLTTVRYLGHDLSQGSRRLSPERVQVIMDTQAAELYALTRACILAQDTDVTIYTDSRYAFGVAHDFGRIWASRGFTTADGKPISHSSLVTDLITACLLPCTLAIVKTRAHTRGDSFEVKGNSFADRVAKAAAASGVLPPGFNCALVSTDRMVSAVLPDIDLISIQASASVADTQFWDAQGATEKSGVLLDAQGRLCLPRHCTPFLVREFHGPTHRGRRGVVEDMNRTFCINNLHTDAHNILDKCLTCAQNNLSKPGVVHQHLPIPDTPFQEWQIDFTHMPKQGPFKYLLVMIDKFSRWIEAFPCSKENARTAVNKLTQEIIPRYGLPVGIDSDKGTPFTSKVTQELCKDLKINWRFHIPYHPQSSGIVERANRTIKGKLRKAMQDAGTKNWVQVLPLVLADMRMTAQVALDNLSPYELVMGCPFPVPWRRGMQVIGTGDLEVHLSEYAVGLMRVLDEYWARVNSKKPPIPEAHTHPFEVGDRVLVKRFAKLNAPMEESPYSGPTDVLAVTRTAVLTDLFPQWIHASRIKKAPM
ncbi:protein NYNRIN-like isoform X2 [Neoarius graeffei]|nr:protein NYNRIN-like isoform X2 [Neoarius graeffei]XP_060766509.1 protein NYNRIN-like isoform X2 [Neoarius graeffei]XP_060766511.1 protein NYNRIN-like isoform X2 [Neoarius graeffei]XP_060766512.1 protein NYNRIN-like isoform X2 [Neoarius graeffei]